MYRFSSSRTFGGPWSRSSNGRSVLSCQKPSPLSTTIACASRPPMLWPTRTIWPNAGSLPPGLNVFSASSERLPQPGRRDRQRHAGRVHVEHELIFFLDARVAQQLVEHRDPDERRRDEAVDHHHGDLPRLVGPDQHQPGAIHVLLGAEQARPSVLRQVGLRPHVGQRRRQVRLDGHLRAGPRPATGGPGRPAPARTRAGRRRASRGASTRAGGTP